MNEDIKSEEIVITEHAYDRAKERLSYNKNALERMANKAYFSGLKHEDTKGKLNKYLTKLWHLHKSANNIRIHGENVFIFINNTLITVYQLPNNLKIWIGLTKKIK